MDDLSFGVQMIVWPPIPERYGSFDLRLSFNHFFADKLSMEECSEGSISLFEEYWRPRSGGTGVSEIFDFFMEAL